MKHDNTAPARWRTRRVRAVGSALIASVMGPAAGCAAVSHVPLSQYVACIAPAVGCDVGFMMQTQPMSMTLSADGSLYVKAISWHGWATSTATGTGIAEANNCQPSCAQGTFVAHPATIVLSDPKLWHDKMAYSRVVESVPAIGWHETFARRLVPSQSAPFSPQPFSQPPTPGPVSTQAQLSGSCAMGYEPAYVDSNGNIAYGPFTAGTPIAYTNVGGTKYTPTAAYQVTLANNGNLTAQVTGFAVAIYDASGTELGSSQKSNLTNLFITSSQSFTWTLYSGTDTAGNGLYGDGGTGIQDDNVPSDGSAASCSFLAWYGQ